MLYDKIVELVGAVPAGLEPVLYIVCVLALIWLLSTFSLFFGRSCSCLEVAAVDDLNLVVGTVFGILTQIFNLYTSTWLLTGFLMLWVFKRVARLFDRL